MPKEKPQTENPPKQRRERFHGRVRRANAAPCARPGCQEPGEFRAPVQDAPNGTWQYFCLDHVREFNAGYSWKGPIPKPTDRWERATQAFAANGYANAFRDDLGIFGQGEVTMPTRDAARWSAKERLALGVLDLGTSASAATIARRYKELVRQYHPDSNGGDRSHEARLQAVLDAYTQLKKASAFKT